MEKLVFCLHRKPGLSRQEFFDHYLQQHAPLGLRLTTTMRGYTVNLTDLGAPDPAAPDAITEVWANSAQEFMDPEKSFATPEDAASLMADHNSFIGPLGAYVVQERIVRTDDAVGPAKRVALYGPGERPPDPGPDVLSVVEHRVVQELMSDLAPVELIVTTTARSVAGLGPWSGRSYDVSEHRMMEPSPG
jgi:uncharacterized protein (TIGR02118 family)